MSFDIGFPRQQLPFSSKTKAWRRRCVDWGADRSIGDDNPIRKSMYHKMINYDLLNGKTHIEDMMNVINPDRIDASYIPSSIQHYPIMNSKLNVLRGEESRRIFDYKVVVTNPTAISEIERERRDALNQAMQQAVMDMSISQDDFNSRIQEISDYFNYNYQDIRELRANCLLNHYVKEYNMPLMFNKGFVDGYCVGEEIYQCDIVGGEPVITQVNPRVINLYMSSYSSKVEDADIVVIENWWSPSRVIDVFCEQLTPNEVKRIEEAFTTETNGEDISDSEESARGFIRITDGYQSPDERYDNNDNISASVLFGDETVHSLTPYDHNGNIRVVQVYWKSRRKVKKVKSYNAVTGEEEYNIYPETYICDKDRGEEEQTLWINQAWEGTKIGKDIYVNMRPRPIQYNSISNPSRCHFGIVGSIYNITGDKPFSLVDIMKPYSYYYDFIHDRLNKAIAKNWGKILQMDIAKVPEGWDVDKWMYFAKVNSIAVVDSFKEGNKGAATGKLAGGLNNASTGVIDLELGNSIQQHINLLEYIKSEMSEVAGISKQREGQISNRETVGGVERATLQSSHITEWLFIIHDDVKKRAMECFLETAKIALRGRSKKFQYILPDGAIRVIDIDGDEFAECDYGMVVDNSSEIQQLKSQIDTLAQAALQNQLLSFSTLMRIYSSCSISEKVRLIERDEQKRQQQAEQTQQQQLQAQQQIAQMQQQEKQAELQLEDAINQRDNETKIVVATISAQSRQNGADDGIIEPDESERLNLQEKIRQFDERLKLDRERLEFDKSKSREELRLKEKQINKPNKTVK